MNQSYKVAVLLFVSLVSNSALSDWEIIQQQTVNAGSGNPGRITNIKIQMSADKMRQEQTPAGNRSRSVLHIIKNGKAFVCGSFRKSSGKCKESKLDAFDMLSGMQGVQIEFKFNKFDFKNLKKTKKISGIKCKNFSLSSALDIVLMKSISSELVTETKGCYAPAIKTAKIFGPAFENSKDFTAKFANEKMAAQFQKMKTMGFPLEQNNKIKMAAMAGAPAMDQRMRLKTLSVKKVKTLKSSVFDMPKGFTISK